MTNTAGELSTLDEKRSRFVRCKCKYMFHKITNLKYSSEFGRMLALIILLHSVFTGSRLFIRALRGNLCSILFQISLKEKLILNSLFKCEYGMLKVIFFFDVIFSFNNFDKLY